MKDIKNYETPDFNVTIYEVEDVITASSPGNVEVGEKDPNEGGDWFG